MMCYRESLKGPSASAARVVVHLGDHGGLPGAKTISVFYGLRGRR